MAKKETIRLTESQLREIVKESVERVLDESVVQTLNSIEYETNKILQSKYGRLLLEEPYSPTPYTIVLDTQARITYIHLAKIFLFGNSTNDANTWLTQALNGHTIPYITSKVTTGDKTKMKKIKEGFIVNFFGKNFEDYETQMRNFCSEAETEVQEGSQKMFHRDAPPHRSIDEAVAIGKNVVIAFATKVCELAKSTNEEEVKSVLIPYMQNLIAPLL